MWERTYTQTTSASPATLWEILRRIDRWGDWNAGIESIVPDGPLAVGTTFVMTPPGEEPVTSRIVEVDEGRLATDLTELGDVAVRVEHRFEPRPEGGSTIAYAVLVTAPSDEEAQGVGEAVSSDFPDVMAALAALAERREMT